MRNRGLLLAACAFSTAVFPGVACAQAGSEATPPTNAQDPASVEEDEVIVTGIRSSLASSANIKRRSDVIVDAISAEDIGKFPDQNVAESLQRVTGIQITRERGQGTGVSVRGFAPSLTRTEYNGRVITTPSGSRNFSFTSLTSDFVSSVEVMKSPTADMVDGGLAATINIKSTRPLDVKNRANLIVEGNYEENSNKVSPHIGGSISRKFADDKIGINLGASYEKRRWFQGVYAAYGLETASEATKGLDYNVDGDRLDTFRLNHAQSHWAEAGADRRITAIGTIEAKPTDDLRVYLDGFYADFQQNLQRDENQTRFTNIAGAKATDPFGVVSSVIDGNGIISALDANGVDNRTDAQLFKTRDKTFSGAFGAVYERDRLTVKSEITYSRANRDTFQSTFGIISRGASAYDMRGGYDEPVVASYTRGYDPTNPSTYNFLTLADTTGGNRTTNYDSRLDLTYKTSDTGFLRSIQVGAYAAKQRTGFLGSIYSTNAKQLAAFLNKPYNADIEASSNGSTPFGSFLTTGEFDSVPGGPAKWILVDRDAFDSAVSVADRQKIGTFNANPTGNYNILEKVLAFYGRVNFASPDDRFGGNVGLRYVKTDQLSTGIAPNLGDIRVSPGGVQTTVGGNIPAITKSKYHNWLPSLNARFNLTDNFVLRFAAARALTRAALSDLRTSLTVNANTRTISSGNPLLLPYLADQADLSAEYYFGGGVGVISAAAFIKRAKDYIIPGTFAETYTVILANNTTETRDFLRTQPLNARGVTIKGIELAAQVPFTFLPAPFDGFGLLANGTYIDAGQLPTSLPAPGQPLTPARSLPGLSKFSYNLGAYFEKGGFGIRASYNYRTKYRVGNGTFNDLDFDRAYGQLDLSSSYDFNDRYGITFDVTNLLKTNLYNDNGVDVLRRIINPGRRFTASIRAKL